VTGDQTRWTDGEVARVVFSPRGTPSEQPTLWLEAAAYLCPNRRSQDVDVHLGGERVGTLHFDERANDMAPRSIPIARRLLAAPIVELELRPRDSRSPVELRCSKSQQLRWGIQVKRLWLE
jgi:hypothetical protein